MKITKQQIQENLDDIEYLQLNLIKSIEERINKYPHRKTDLIELEEVLLQEFYRQHMSLTLIMVLQ